MNTKFRSWRKEMAQSRFLHCLGCVLSFMVLGFSCVIASASSAVDLEGSCSGSLSKIECLTLSSLPLDGYLTFYETSYAAQDFGRLRSFLPAAVLHPASTADIVSVVDVVLLSSSNLSIAARGPGHSIYGQSQALGGVVIEMSALKGIRVDVAGMYVEASAGELWIDVLKETLKQGLSPRSFTDYLHLSVGGTLSNAGISGQSFIWGPQINNVLQLEVLTGTAMLVTCSRLVRPDLFFAVLGGLGQFGIITKARINLQSAPRNVNWVRAIYSDFASFRRDQELLISMPLANSSAVFEYVEGFVIANSPSSQFGYNSVPFENHVVNATLLPESAATPVLYYIELAKYYNNITEPASALRKRMEKVLGRLRHIPGQIFSFDTSYMDFLERVHKTELYLKSVGQWEVPHPWINLLVPASKMTEFDHTVFQSLEPSTINGPIIVYPFNRNKWETKMSAVIPDEDIFYVVAFLQSVVPSMGPNLQTVLARNSNVWKYCEALGCKQYLPKHSTIADWQVHFGDKWNNFVLNKIKFDPRAILAPGQNIFPGGQIMTSLLDGKS